MRIGILEAGRINDAMAARHGSYTPMYTHLLQSADPAIETFAVHVYDGDMPNDPEAADGWLVSGSIHGAYENLPWIPKLEQFLREAITAKVPVVGVCFGHQILAQALGGRVEKAKVGWGIGAAQFTMTQTPAWAAPLGDAYTNYVAHQDQVIDLPTGATTLASADYCPHAAAYYGPQDAAYALTVQAHPEFDVTFMEDLITLREGSKSITATDAAQARSSLAMPNDNAAWAKVLADFFQTAQKQRAL